MADPLGTFGASETPGAGGKSCAASKLIPVERHPGPKPPGDLLDSRNLADPDEAYSENERALQEFLKLHPMLSLESTSAKTLSEIAKLSKLVDIKMPEPEVVSMDYDNAFLKRADRTQGHRECVLGEKCICRWLSVFRYGEESDKCFVCREYLLPSQLETYQKSKKLPSQHGKCLICTRYFASYAYYLARSSPTFKCETPVTLQAFSNQVTTCKLGDEVPPIANATGAIDAYRPDVILYIDESAANTEAARGKLSHLMFNPIVRFKCGDYDFVRDEETNEWRLSQHRLGVRYFRAPAS